MWCEVETRGGGERCVLSLLNTNASLTAKDLPLLTEPFWRKDASRGTSSDNAGLGLSLVAAYANLLRTPDTFAATLELPIAHGTAPPTLRGEAPEDVAKLAPANMIAP